MQQRKNAHLERRAQLTAERKAAAGDPVRGLPTPFVESFDSGGQAPLSKPRLDDDGNPLEERDEEMAGYDPHRRVVVEAVDRMIAIALDAVARPLPAA